MAILLQEAMAADTDMVTDTGTVMAMAPAIMAKIQMNHNHGIKGYLAGKNEA